MTSNGHQSGKPLRAGDPRELDGYRIVSRLGRGGMGTVYLAKDASDRSVAIKLIHPDLADDESFRLRFAREVESARRVARFSTAGVIDAKLEGEPLFIVSEYVPGPNLDQAIRADGSMGGGTLEGLAMGVAAALTAIHGAGIVHRDLKPSNVLLSPVGPKVIDFGIARALDGTGGAVTRSSQLMGTPSYMAPELILGRQATAAADIFAWGCLVAFAGTGSAPFDAATVPAVLHNISSAPPRLGGLDPSLHDLVSTALGKEPENRPSSKQILARLTGQEDPPEEEVRRTITTSWAPPSSAPVPGEPPPGLEQPSAAEVRTAQGQPPPGYQGPSGGHPPLPPPPPAHPMQGQPTYGRPAHNQPGRGRPVHNQPAPGQPMYGQPVYHQAPYSPPHGQTTFAAHAGPGGPGGPAGPGGPGQAGGGTPPKRGRGKLLLIGGAVGAVVLIAGIGIFAFLSASSAPPDNTVSVYGHDFGTDPGWANGTYEDGRSDGYWAGRGMLLQLDPTDQPSRGEVAPIDEELPDRVVVNATAHVIAGPEQALLGVRCWDNDGEDERTMYEALLRYDGQRAEIRRVTEESGNRAIAETNDVPGYEVYPLYDEARDTETDADPYDIGADDDMAANSLTFSCEYVAEEDEDPLMRLRMWVNGDLALEATDDDPLPEDGEEATDRRRVGVVTRTGPGNEPLGVLFTAFSVDEVIEE